MWIRIWIRIRTLLVTGTDLVSEIPEAEDVLLLDLAEDREEGRLHSVTVQRVLPCLNNPSCGQISKFFLSF